MRVLIVDDERPARERLHRLLAAEADVTAVAHACDGVDALQQLGFAPDVIFLDVQMPEVSGLEVAASLPDPAPLVVFATAYDEYAVRAFDANAVDYLLKPFDQQRLQRAMARVRERLAQRQAAPRMALAGISPRQLLVTERGVTQVVKVDAIGWIETADNYVVLHTAGAAPLLRQSLAGLLAQLGPGFIRCHRRAAVQVSWIERIVTLEKGDAELLLRGGMRVPCSRQFRADVLARLSLGR